MKYACLKLASGFFLAVGIAVCSGIAFSGVTPERGRSLAPEVRAHLDEAKALGLFREPGDPILGPGLTQKAALTPKARVKVWVFFTDKGIGTRSGLTRALQTVRRSFSETVLRRRTTLGPDMGVDFRDLPVYPGYVSQLRDGGYVVHRESRWLNAVSMSTPADNLSDLSGFSFVRHVQPVLVRKSPLPPLPDQANPHRGRIYQPQAVTPSPVDSLLLSFYGSSYNQLDQIEAVDLHRLGYTGAGVRVMMLDTGFRKDHPVFDCAGLVAEWDFVNEDGNTQNEGGDHGSQHDHGTGVWGVTGGYAPGSLIGPAFGAEFLLAKTEDIVQEVRAEEDNYVAALEWGDTMGVEIASASLAYFTFDDSTGYTTADLDGDTAVITVAVDIAVSKGIACVNAMGNSGPNPTTLWTPADADSVIAVGAADSCGVVTGFSSRGPSADGRIKPEISAKGLQTTWAVASDLGYGQASGTSLATPLIGGLAALIKEAHPTWTGYQIREALIGTGTLSLSPDNNLGYGMAQGLGALGFAGATAEPPRMTLPFHLLLPQDGSAVNTVSPTLVWTASAAADGDQAAYRVIIDDNPDFSFPDTMNADSDTTYTMVLGIQPGETRWWKVEAIGNQGFARKSMNIHSFSVDAALAVGPGRRTVSGFAVGLAAPNPMIQTAAIPFLAPDGDPLLLDILSVSGRLIRRIPLLGTGGWSRVIWDGQDNSGIRVPAGVYFYRLSGGRGSRTRKLVRLP